ncbi:MAG: phosphonate degradation HD-domain oxygenase [Cyanobacteria bacterium J06642_2]
MKTISTDDIAAIFERKGSDRYGETAVSQLEHALQCAALAEFVDASPASIAASLLHDVGHLLHGLGQDAAERGIDDRHEYRALPYLKSQFSPAVTEPIRLHVDAKRYLCAIDENYWSTLSPASKLSLELQGGIFSVEEAREFGDRPYAQDAMQLRIWDDKAKVEGLVTPDLKHFLDVAVRASVSAQASL